MRKSELITKEELQRYEELCNRCEQLKEAMLKMTPETKEEDRQKITVEYDELCKEREKIAEQIATTQTKIKERLRRVNEKKDNADLKAFDEDITDFLDALYDYYETCKVRLYKMLEELETKKKLTLREKLGKWRLKREIQREIDYYTREQQMCNP